MVKKKKKKNSIKKSMNLIKKNISFQITKKTGFLKWKSFPQNCHDECHNAQALSTNLIVLGTD